MKKLIGILGIMAFLAASVSCEKAGPQGNGGSGGGIGAEDLTLELELTTETPMVYNGGTLVIKIKTNRSKLKVVKFVSEFKFPEINVDQTYDNIVDEITFVSEPVSIYSEGEGEARITLYDEVLKENRELSVSYYRTTEDAVMPKSITLSANDISLSRDETVNIGYTVIPAEAKRSVGVRRVDYYDSSLTYTNDTESGSIRLTGGKRGGKVRLKVYAVADTTVYTYLDLYVRHRVALELDIKSTGNDVHVFWKEMPTSATARLVTWVGEIDENNSLSADVSFSDFSYGLPVKATFYVNISTDQAGRESKYFYGGNKDYVWNPAIKMGGEKYYGQGSKWSKEKHTGTQWSWFNKITDIKRYSNYSAKTKAESVEISQPKSYDLPVLLGYLQANNDYRWWSNNWKTGPNFNNGGWNTTGWKLYYITVEDLVYDKSKMDLVYIFHRYRLKVNGTYYSGSYYWKNADQGSWAEKVE